MLTRRHLYIALAGVLLLLAAISAVGNYHAACEWWSVPQLALPFGDLRVVTSGAEVRAQGGDPLRANLLDPWHRPMNYPRVWQGLAFLGVRQAFTVPLGWLLITLFLGGLAMAMPPLRLGAFALLLAAILSPAVLLGCDRGNVDLVIFALLALALALPSSRWVGASVLIFAAFVLKLFPLFAMALLLRQRPRVVWGVAAASALLAGLYVALTWQDLLLIRQTTPSDGNLSYGVDVLWRALLPLAPAASAAAHWLCRAGLLAGLLLLALTLARRPHAAPPPPSRELDAFRVGSAIYVGTYCLGTNYDYRLMFLLFTIPQLWLWATGSQRAYVRVARTLLLALLLALYHFPLDHYHDAVPGGKLTVTLLDEAAHWLLFFGLLYLGADTLPAWLRRPLAPPSSATPTPAAASDGLTRAARKRATRRG